MRNPTRKNNSIQTFVDLIEHRAAENSGRTAFIFLPNGETEKFEITYGEIARKARKIGGYLQKMNAFEERVLLLYPSGIEFICAFLGCLYAGAIAVPAYPPRRNRHFERINSIIENSESKFILSDKIIKKRTTAVSEDSEFLSGLNWIDEQNITDEFENLWQYPNITEQNTAFLQYTSGSTGSPKGVIVSHENLLHNESLIKDAFRQDENSVIVSWLPLYHDMGLIGSVLQTLFSGAKCVLMSPASFLQHPFRWLKAISDYRATTSGAPNFAYDLCVNRIAPDELEKLDLSSWTTAFNGAEPVNPATIEKFSRHFASAGFKKESFAPCYGLAEATLFVSGNTGGQKDSFVENFNAPELEKNIAVFSEVESEQTRALVGCGKVFGNQEIAIVSPENNERLGTNEIGEIWISGKSVAGGYWKNSEATNEIFNAKINEDDNKNYLRTGDLGFLSDGNLFVTGRLKDLIIIRGRNYYPQDIESTVYQSHKMLYHGNGAAFSVTDANESEKLVIVQEADSHFSGDWETVIDEISKAVSLTHDLQPSAICLVKRLQIPKTSSGKIQRNLCREKYLNGEFNVIAEWKPEDNNKKDQSLAANPEEDLTVVDWDAGQYEKWLVNEIAALIGIAPNKIAVDQNLINLGLDSLSAAELAHKIESKTQRIIPISQFLQDFSISQIARQIKENDFKTIENEAFKSPLKPSGKYELSAGQKAILFIQQLSPENSSYNISSAVKIISPLKPELLKRSFEVLIERHPALRTAFFSDGEKSFQEIIENTEVDFKFHNVRDWDEQKLKNYINEESNKPFDLTNAPLIRLNLFVIGFE